MREAAPMIPSRSLPIHELSTIPVVHRAVLQARAEPDAAVRALGLPFAAWLAGLRHRRPAPSAAIPLEPAA